MSNFSFSHVDQIGKLLRPSLVFFSLFFPFVVFLTLSMIKDRFCPIILVLYLKLHAYIFVKGDVSYAPIVIRCITHLKDLWLILYGLLIHQLLLDHYLFTLSNLTNYLGATKKLLFHYNLNMERALNEGRGRVMMPRPPLPLPTTSLPPPSTSTTTSSFASFASNPNAITTNTDFNGDWPSETLLGPTPSAMVDE